MANRLKEHPRSQSGERVTRICEDIARHYQEVVAPNGFKGMVVTFDQECCILYKAALDNLLPPEATDVVIDPTPIP